MPNQLEDARTIAHVYLRASEKTPENILQIVEKLKATPEFDFDADELFEILLADYSIGSGSISSLSSDDLVPWLNDEKANIEFELWNRYKLHLSLSDPSFPTRELDDFTDKILDKCANPRQNSSFDRRGMVVGHVQSGKTSNYVGLINKAADAGYKVIIVIAGTISSLRRQTQERIDEGFIGRSSAAYIRNNETRVTGVGKYKVKSNIYSLTSSYYKKGDEGDFSQAIATRLNIPIGDNPIILVIKKNKSIIENLIDWLARDSNVVNIEGQPKICNVPALIIDDEADSASVNATKDITEIKTINRLIRTLINLFDQSTFIGYTATPYANLFISQEWDETKTTTIKGQDYLVGEDLFPRDFIINIKAPANYIGAAKVFGLTNPQTGVSKEPLDVFRSISDFDPPFFSTLNLNNKDQLPEYLPNSLKQAILAFILTCTIRRLRGHERKHNSMLVHVALYVKWIDRVAKLVNECLEDYKNKIAGDDPDTLNSLKTIYELDFIPTTDNVLDNLDYKDIRIKKHSWNDVMVELKAATSKIEVRAVHGVKSTAELEYSKIEEIDYKLYESGLSVIAVGGSRLARGITLEGLSISYYLRTTKMYDSLMQMGRWFGYRPGYVDLCRIYTTQTIYSWFNHITMATEEMRNDFDELTASNRKPKDFRLKVRNHHGLLTITSLSKLYSAGNIEISFSGSNPQTYLLLKDRPSIESNFRAYEKLLHSLGYPETVNIERNRNNSQIRYVVYRNVNINLLNEFLTSYKINLPSINSDVLTQYITKQNSSNKISEWSICVVSNTDNNVNLYKNLPSKDSPIIESAKSYSVDINGKSLELKCSVRNQTEANDNYKITKNQIDDLTDRQVDLQIRNLSTTNLVKEQRSKEKKGLLLLYALDNRGTYNVEGDTPIIGYSLHFPKIEDEVKVSYTITLNNSLDEDVMFDDDLIQD